MLKAVLMRKCLLVGGLNSKLLASQDYIVRTHLKKNLNKIKKHNEQIQLSGRVFA